MCDKVFCGFAKGDWAVCKEAQSEVMIAAQYASYRPGNVAVVKMPRRSADGIFAGWERAFPMLCAIKGIKNFGASILFSSRGGLFRFKSGVRSAAISHIVSEP